jgi:hypothetical protein
MLLMVLITFYVTLVDTALSPGNSEAGEFDDVDMSSTSCSSSSVAWSHLPRLALRCPQALLRRNIPPSLLDRVVLRVLMMMLLMPMPWPPHRVGRRVLLMMLLPSLLHRAGCCVSLMMLITFYFTPVNTALSPGYSYLSNFEDVDVIHFVFIFEPLCGHIYPSWHCVVPRLFRGNIPPSLLQVIVRR